MAAELVLGPLLRHVGAATATVWVETDRPCEVEVLGHRAATFTVEDHHFAVVCVDGLEPGTATPYEVRLDGERRWPLDGAADPPPVIRTPAEGDPLTLAFGSCRVGVPNEPPYTLRKRDHPKGREVDALRSFAERMRDQSPQEWPHGLLLLGDQVYADDVSPATRAFIRGRRSTGSGAEDQVADFEEYTRLYRESWSDPVIRWLLSTVPTAMIFDDHDVHDDWNTSEAWRAKMHAQPWWQERIVGALTSYWCYQHLGNLSPEDLERDKIYRAVREAGDGTEVLREFARRADVDTESARWSFRRDWHGVRLVMIDSRAGRVLGAGQRSMLDAAEWRWLEETATGDVDHLLLGTSLPWLLERGMHELEAWNEAVCGGAWGRRAIRFGELVRQGLDLEHWAAFGSSFERLTRIVTDVATGRRGAPPATVIALSGDVHHAYLTTVDLKQPDAASRVYQAVCSPFRNPLDARERAAIRLAGSWLGAWIGTALARAAGVRRTRISWRRKHRAPWFDNQIATLRLEGREATLRLERATPEQPWLTTVLHDRL